MRRRNIVTDVMDTEALSELRANLHERAVGMADSAEPMSELTAWLEDFASFVEDCSRQGVSLADV